MTRLVNKLYLESSPTDNPHGFIETVSAFATSLGSLLFAPTEMPEWVPEGHAMFMAAGTGLGKSPQDFIANVEWTHLERELGISKAEALGLLARGFAAAGLAVNAEVADIAARHEAGEPIRAIELSKEYPVVDNPQALVESMGKILQARVEVEVLTSRETNDRLRNAIDAIDGGRYWSRAAAAADRLPAQMWTNLATVQARLYRHVHVAHTGVTGLPSLRRGVSMLGGLLNTSDRLSEHGVFSIYRLDTSQGELHLVTYRDFIVLRHPDGEELARKHNPQNYDQGTPGSRFWAVDEAPDWRLEQIDGGGWVAAY